MFVLDKQFSFGNQIRKIFLTASERYGLKQRLLKSTQFSVYVKKNFVIEGFVMSFNNTLNSARRNLFVSFIAQKNDLQFKFIEIGGEHL